MTKRAPPAPSSWSDLLIEVGPDTPTRAWLDPWSWLVDGRPSVCYLNRLGCWFLQRPSGSIEMLDVFYGLVDEVASSFEELLELTNDRSWQEVYLFSDLVSRLHRSGCVATGTDGYAIAPPPAAGGPDPWGPEPLPVESLMVVDVAVLQRLYAQVARAARDADPP